MTTRPQDIREYYLRSREALSLLQIAFRDPAFAGRIPAGSPFFKLTASQLPDVLAEMVRELELETSLALFASFEAILRTDFNRRAATQSSCPPQIKKLWKKTKGQPLRLEDLLNAWRDAHPTSAQVVGDFKTVLRWRHWLAHGRYWPQKGFAGFDIRNVSNAAVTLQNAIPDFPRLIDW